MKGVEGKAVRVYYCRPSLFLITAAESPSSTVKRWVFLGVGVGEGFTFV